MPDTFAGTTADVYTDPVTHGPVVGAQLLVYTAPTGGTQITSLTDWAGTSLPGYVTTDSVGAFSFKTVDSYSIVWIQDPSGERYQCQSRESVLAGVNAAAQIPQLQTDTANAVATANSASEFTSTMGEDIQFQGMVSGVGSVDVRTATPVQAVTLAPSTTGVIQGAMREQTSGEWYVSHNQTGTVSGRETTVVDRLSATGTLLDTMTLTDAGHGTYIFPQHRDDGNVWIWVPVHLYDTTGNILSTNLYRILYRGGTTITNVSTDAPNSVMVVASGPTTSTQAYLDVSGDRIVISVNGAYSLYDQADLETNALAATKIGKTIPVQGGTVQGVAVAGTSLYRLTGADNTTNSTAEPKLITVFSLLTGQQLYQRDVTAAVPTGEPEGLSLWRDQTGLPALYMGLSSGAGGARTSYTFAMTSGMVSALGQISLNLGSFATPDQLTGVADAGPAWQAAIDALPAAGGRLIVPPGSTFWFSGATAAVLRSNTEIDLRGSTIKKTDDTGSYVIFAALTGVHSVTLRNGYFLGALSTAGNLCVIAGNRASNFLIENCQFDGCQGAGHTFDLCGCDGFTFRDCVWRGFDSSVTNAPHCEAVECDISYQGTVSYADPAGYDGTATQNVTIDNCQYLPWTDPSTSITYASPIPIGAHTVSEGNWYQNIRIRNVVVVDPMVDPQANNILGNDAFPAGLIHFPSVKGLLVSGMRVVASNGQGSIRIVMVSSRTTGIPTSSDYGVTINQGPFATPQGCQDISIEGLQVLGMGGTASSLNPLIVACGSEAPIQNVKVNMSADMAYKQIVQLYGCTDVTANVNGQNTTSVGVRLAKCQRVNVTGNFKECGYAVSVDGSNQLSIGPLTAVKTGTVSTGVVLSQTTYGASDYLAINGVMATGYTNLLYGTAITHQALGGSIPATAVAA